MEPVASSSLFCHISPLSPRRPAGLSRVPALRVQRGEPQVLAGLRGLPGVSFKDQSQRHLPPVHQPWRPTRGECTVRYGSSIGKDGEAWPESWLDLMVCRLNLSFTSPQSGKPGCRDPWGSVERDGLSVRWHLQRGPAENLQSDGQRLLPEVPAFLSLRRGRQGLLNAATINRRSICWLYCRLFYKLACDCLLLRSAVVVYCINAVWTVAKVTVWPHVWTNT